MAPPSNQNRDLYRESITRLSSALLELSDISPVPLTEIDDSHEKLDIRTTKSEYAETWELIYNAVTGNLSDPTVVSHVINQYDDEDQLHVSSIYPLSGSETTYVVLTVQYAPNGQCLIYSSHRPDTTEPLQRFLPATRLEDLTEKEITIMRDRGLKKWG